MGKARGEPDAWRHARRVRVGGPGKRAGGDTGTAPWADLTTAVHVADHEARPAVRPLTRVEVQALFDLADDHVDFARSSKRKGWLTLFPDATLFKVIYAYGLRRREAAMLDLHDFTRNPKALEFGRFGVCNVRWGKSTRGSQPRRRAVLTVFDWTRPVLEEYVEEVLPRFGMADGAVLWPTERQGRIRLAHIDDRFADWRDQLALDPVLHPHCLRHSYVTHLIEDGFDPLFVQQQVGHRWVRPPRSTPASPATTAIACCATPWTRRSPRRSTLPLKGTEQP